MNFRAVLIAVFVVLISIAWVQAGQRSIAINIYNDGFSQVTETRQVEMANGLINLKLHDIAEKIDPGSISLSGDGFEIRTVDYRYDLVSADRLLRKYIGQEIEFKKDDSLYSGSLINFDEDYLYIASNDKPGSVSIFERDDFKHVGLPKLSEGLVTRPMVNATVHSSVSGKQDVKLSYLTTGLGWQAEYHLAYNGKNSAEITAWINLDNQCGAAFPEAEIILIAGQVEREEATAGPSTMAEGREAYRPRKSSLEPLVDYHRYKLPFETTLGEMETKQAVLFEQQTIEVERYYKYEWSETKSDVKSIISFANDSDTGLGKPMPSGRMSIYDRESGAFLGSGKFESTPAGEEAEIFLGTAFDIKAERKRIDHKKIGRNKNSDSFEIIIRNHKSEKAKVIVCEEIYGYWEITEKSDDFTKEDFQNIEFEVYVEPGREKVITYTVEYSY
ncbi:MAG: hypothetical protein GY839_10710 [candidate division Zixibacteria bacterium]|nr:hypothetical protein [candidate division Zixibacteria bacterium]